MKSTTPEIAWLGDIAIACERVSVYLKGVERNAVHEYDSVDWNIVWEVATMQIPKLLETLQPLLPPNGE